MKRTKEDIYIIAYIILMSTMLFARDIVGIGMHKYIFLIISTAFMVILPIEYFVYLLVFTFPLFCGLPAAHIRIVAIGLYLFKKKEVTLAQLFLSVFVILWELLAVNWYPYFNMGDVMGYLSAPVMLFLLLWDRNDGNKINYKKCVDLFLIGFGVVCFVIMATAFVKSTTHWLTAFSQGLFRESMTETDKTAEGVVTKMNANTLAYFCCVCTALSLTIAKHVTYEKSKNKVLYYVVASLYAIVCVFSLSRSGILVLAATISIYMIASMKTIKGIIISIFSLSLIIVVVYVFIQMRPDLYSSIYARFTDYSAETAGGRTELFQEYMNVFLSNERFMWLGTGVVEYRVMTNVWNSMHNGTQQILVCMGIPGFIIFLIGLFLPFYKERRVNRIPFFYWIPLVAAVAFTQTIQFLAPTILMFPIILCYYSIKLGVEDSQIKRK